jgi:zinc transport system ATP-binding protein
MSVSTTATATSSPTSTTVIEARDACVELGSRPVLRGVDLTVRAGEMVAVLGANGSGKSTLVRSVLGLVPLRRGSTTLYGRPVAQFSDWGRVGFVPQRTSATSGVPASVREVVSSGRLARRRLFVPMRRADKDAVDRALASVDLSDRAGDRVSQLSGGQQQRVLIARALAGEPDLLVLDEPTAGVDLTTQESLAALLGRLVAGGTAVLLVAHELGPLAPLVHRTVVLRGGRKVYDGAPLPTFHDLPHNPAHHPPPGGPDDHRPHLDAPLDRAPRGESP